MDPSLRAHSEAKGEAIQKQHLDCFVALLLAMTRALGQFRRNPLLAKTSLANQDAERAPVSFDYCLGEIA
jgi:hypothetical protein